MVKFIQILSLLCVISITTYSYRSTFSYKYDPAGAEANFNNSQYVYPNGTQILDDNSLYKVVGYKIINGENPFFVNYDVPPFIKSLFGLSEVLFSNPYYVTYFFYLLSLISVYLLAQQIIKNRNVSWLATLLFASSPLAAAQVGQTMLDLPLATFFVLHVIFFLRIFSTKRPLLYTILAGVMVGFMAGTKTAYYIPAILVFDLVFLVWQRQKRRLFLVLIAFSLFGYVISYFSYFIRHPNPIPWIRLHQKVIEFYSGNKPPPYYLNEVRTIFLNKYQGWWRPDSIPMVEWSIILPVGFLATLALTLNKKNFANKNLLYLLASTWMLLIMTSLIPFWPRYLVLILPSFCIITAYLIQKHRLVFISILILQIYQLVQFLP